VPKFTNAKKALVKSIMTNLTIKRIPESQIIKEVYKLTNKTITRRILYNLRQQIKFKPLGWIFLGLRNNPTGYSLLFYNKIL